MENNMFSGIFRGLKIKNREKSQFFTCLVEAAGVEPASENIFTRASPSAVYGQNSRLCKSTNNLTNLVASLCMLAAKLTQVTFTARSRPVPCRSPHGQDGSFN